MYFCFSLIVFNVFCLFGTVHNRDYELWYKLIHTAYELVYAIISTGVIVRISYLIMANEQPGYLVSLMF